MSKEYAFKLKGFVSMIPCRQYCSNITKNVKSQNHQKENT